MLKKIFPSIVTGPTVMLIGVKLIQTGFKTWAGGSGPCADASPAAFFEKCPNINAHHALPWGSGEYIGLGFVVFITILLMERFGSPIMKSASVIMGLLMISALLVLIGNLVSDVLVAVADPRIRLG